MYSPRDFQNTNIQAAHQLMIDYSFATLMTVDSEGPFISHIPMLLEPNIGSQGMLIGHVSRGNDHWQRFEKADFTTAIFHGPHAYISPRWYETSTSNVPTWNYAVVHAHGKIRICTEPSTAWSRMVNMVKHFDPKWKLEENAERMQLLAGIVVFEFTIERIEAKFKLSQNRLPKDAANVLHELSQSKFENERSTAHMMKNLLSDLAPVKTENIP